MRNPRLSWISIALGVLMLPACDGAREDPVAPAVDVLVAAASAPQTGSGNGAVIIRFPNNQFILIFDAERQLLAAHMPSNICGDGAFNVVQFQRVETPSEIGQVLAKQTANEDVSIYHASSLDEVGVASDIGFIAFSDLVDIGKFCTFMSGPNRIAEGIVNQLATFSFASFHARWVGTIQGVDGRDYRLNEVYQLNADIFDPNDPDTFSEPVVRIQLQPVG